MRRINNPRNKHKPELAHIAHTQERMLERFGINLSIDDYYNLITHSQETHKNVYSLNNCTVIWEITYREKLMWIVYTGKDKVLPARIKTVLHPYEQYLTPDVLYKIYDHQTYTVAIREAIEKMVELSKELDLNDKKTFFIKPYHKSLKDGALRFKQGHSINSPVLTRIATNYLLAINNVAKPSENASEL